MPQSLSNLIMHLKPYWLDSIAKLALPTEGPDIDIVAPAQIGRGGDTILLFDSGGNPVAEFAPTGAGLIAALAVATSGDLVLIQAMTISLTAGISIPAGVYLQGLGIQNTILNYAGTDTDMIIVNTASEISDMSVNYTTTFSGGDTNFGAIWLKGGIVHDLHVSITGSQYFLAGIYGSPYHSPVDELLFESIYNVSIYVNNNNDGANSECWAFGLQLGYNNASEEDYWAFIHDISIFVSTTQVDTSAGMTVYGAWIESKRRVEVRDLYCFVDANGPAADGGDVLITGISGSDANAGGVVKFENCYARVDINDVSNGVVGTGIYPPSDIYNCIAEIVYISGAGTGYVTALSNPGYNFYHCIGVATSTGSGTAYGGDSGSILANFFYCVFNGTTYDFAAWFTANVYACQYDTLYGTLIALAGDTEKRGIRTTNTITAGATTLDWTYEVILGDAIGGAITVNLPAAASNPGRQYTIKKIDNSANTITIDGNGGETIDDQATQIINTQYDSLTIISDGSEWWIL